MAELRAFSVIDVRKAHVWKSSPSQRRRDWPTSTVTLLTLYWEMPDALAIQREGEGDERGVDRKGERRRRMRQESEIREEGCWGRECWSVPWSCNTWWRGGKRDTEGDRWARVRTGKEKKAISKNEQERGEIRAGREENFRKGRCMQGELQKCCSCCKEPQLLTAWTLLSACLPEWWSAVLQWRLYQSGCTTTGLYIVMSLLCILVHQLDVPHVEEVADGCSVL